MTGILGRFNGAFTRCPPRRYTEADYKRWFPKTAGLFLRNLKRSHAFPVTTEQGGSLIGLVVAPWLETATPWYSILLANGLARRGRRTVLLWDDTGFPEARVDEQNRLIGDVLAYVGTFVEVVRLSRLHPVAGRADDGDLLDELAAQNAHWTLRGGPPLAHTRAYEGDVRRSLERSLPYVRAAVRHPDLDCILTCGGVYGTSGLFVMAGAEVDVRVATYDADVGVAQVCTDGVASQCQDIPRAFDALVHAPEDERRRAIAVGRDEFQRRTEGRDRYGFQAVPSGNGATGSDSGILIPLNVDWDSSALGKHVHFDSTEEWLIATITAILAVDDGPVTVRQHPSERRPLQAGRLDIAGLLQDEFPDDPRVRFVSAQDAVSTYDLMRTARLVLPFVSTIAIEAAGTGKPVLVAGDSYFSDLGFVWSAETREEYFALLRRGLRGEFALEPEQIDRAWLCYYLTAVRNRVWSDFTPQPNDFWHWCQRTSDELFSDPQVSDMLEAVDRGIPISLLRHRKTSCATLA